MVKKNNLKQLLNLNFLDLTNQTYLIGKYDMPYIGCPLLPCPDYLALYTEKHNYFKTENTWICFYVYDKCFDNINGLFNAIYYGDEKHLQKMKERLKGVKYAIAPDYSQCGDVPRIENLYRLFKSRIVSLWLLMELDIIVVPNVTYANENYFDVMLEGMDECEVVGFSVKGSIKEPVERELLCKAIKQTVDSLTKLKTIVVYSVSVNDEKVLKLFEYATSKNIKVIIPNNILKQRNIALMEARADGKNK